MNQNFYFVKTIEKRSGTRKQNKFTEIIPQNTYKYSAKHGTVFVFHFLSQQQ